MHITVNNKLYEVADEPDRPLLWILRDELGLTGTKYSCGIGACGSCEVHINGKVVRSCVTNLSEVKGKSIRTIEGLANEDGTLHPVQQAFIDEQVPQCGWCMSGQIMRAAAFLEAHPDPTEDQIVSEMNENICRCGAYGRIKKAVLRAAGSMAKKRKA
jgi:isoquinoline 1-oxidoreductase alpha subunit